MLSGPHQIQALASPPSGASAASEQELWRTRQLPSVCLPPVGSDATAGPTKGLAVLGTFWDVLHAPHMALPTPPAARPHPTLQRTLRRAVPTCPHLHGTKGPSLPVCSSPDRHLGRGEGGGPDSYHLSKLYNTDKNKLQKHNQSPEADSLRGRWLQSGPCDGQQTAGTLVWLWGTDGPSTPVSGEPCSCSGCFLLPAPHVAPQGLPHLPCSLAPFSAPHRTQQSCTHSLTDDRVPCAPGMAGAEVNTHGRVETGEGVAVPRLRASLKTPSFSQDNSSESPGTLFLGAPWGSDKPCWWGPEALPTPPLVVSAQLLSPLDRRPPPL